MMTKLEAVNDLANYDHCFLNPEGVKQIGKPFGVYKTVIREDTRSQFKGLNLGEGYKEGDSAEGLDAHILAELLCEKEGLEYPRFFGIGSQLRGCIEVLRKHLEKR